MIHFIRKSAHTAQEISGPCAEAVSRLALICQALACAEQFSGEQPSDSLVEAKLAAAWPSTSPARQRVYEARSTRTAAAAGLEMLAAHQDAGKEPHPAAIERLKRELGEGVRSIDQLFSL